MGTRWRRIVAYAAAAGGVLFLLFWLRPGEDARLEPRATTAAVPSAEPVPAAPPHEHPATNDLRPAAPPIAAAEPGAADPDLGLPEEMEPGDDQEQIAAAWASVDLEAVRQALPDNLYFDLAAPTQDEAEVERRAAERRRWNAEHGKIVSGTATEEEITAYYDQRARLSTDYIEFATHLLDHYRDALPQRDVNLLELARKLHAARLEEIPRKVEEAFERKRQQDEARAAWLADEAEFGSGDAGADPTDAAD